MATADPLRLSPPPDGDRDRGQVIIIVESVFVSISLALVLARIYVRTRIISHFGLDDVFIIFGMLLALTVLALTVLMVHAGVGRHLYYLSMQPEELQQAIKWQFILQPFLLCSTMFTKLSVSLFLLRIFGTKSHWRWGLYSIMAFSVLSSVLSSAVIVAQCQPVQKVWNPDVPGRCKGPELVTQFGYFNGAISVFCDWTLASLPIAFMWNLQMDIRAKVAICVLMGMGFFSGICVLLRTVFVRELAAPDITWNILDLAIWSILEETTGIIAACIPTLKPLFDISVKHFSKNTKSLNRISIVGSSALGDNTSKNRYLHSTRVKLDHLRSTSSSNKEYLHLDGSKVNIESTTGDISRQVSLSSAKGIRKDLAFSVERSSTVREDLDEC